MPHGSDYYRTLGVPKTATPDQVKRAYRKLAKQHHPDRNPGDEAAEGKFKKVQQAYDVLGDAQKRAEYDRFGEAGVGQFATDPGGRKVYQWGANSTINADDLEDLLGAFSRGGGTERPSVFEEMFGGFRRRSRGPRAASAEPRRGADAERDISLTLEQVAKGAVVTARLGPRSNGKSEALDVKIPAGVEDGQRIRLAGRGGAGAHGGTPGDFYFVCRVKPHAFFRRAGADVFLDVPISVAEAVLGAKVEVPTIDGRASVSVPAGTASGAKLRLKGRGLPTTGGRGKRGDQYVLISIAPPTTISDEVRSIAERLREADRSDPRGTCAWAETAEQ